MADSKPAAVPVEPADAKKKVRELLQMIGAETSGKGVYKALNEISDQVLAQLIDKDTKEWLTKSVCRFHTFVKDDTRLIRAFCISWIVAAMKEVTMTDGNLTVMDTCKQLAEAKDKASLNNAEIYFSAFTVYEEQLKAAEASDELSTTVGNLVATATEQGKTIEEIARKQLADDAEREAEREAERKSRKRKAQIEALPKFKERAAFVEEMEKTRVECARVNKKFNEMQIQLPVLEKELKLQIEALDAGEPEPAAPQASGAREQ